MSCRCCALTSATASSATCLSPLKFLILSQFPFPKRSGFNQTMNDYYDRDIDAINEPYRPIPSGAVSLQAVQAQIWILLAMGMGLAAGLDVWTGHDFPTIALLCAVGAYMSYAYSVPSIKVCPGRAPPFSFSFHRRMSRHLRRFVALDLQSFPAQEERLVRGAGHGVHVHRHALVGWAAPLCQVRKQ